MRKMFWVFFLIFGLILSWSMVYAADFYVIPVKKCCTCKGTLYENRWCDNQDGTVTDMTTCLVWLKWAGWGEQRPWRSNTPDDYDDAHTRAALLCDGTKLFGSGQYVITLNDGSVEGDWRLPTKSELLGLLDGPPPINCYPGPCNMYGFSGIQGACYWSSSTQISNDHYAYVVCAHHGPLWSLNIKYSTMPYVWPVRDAK